MIVDAPYYAVWEITLACNLACRHCGSRAGKKRPYELSTDEALRVVGDLADLGVQEVTLVGGETYLRPDWDSILRALADRGIRTSIATGGRGLDRERARRARQAGVGSVGVSVDGLKATHDWLRGVSGSFDSALQAMDHLRAERIPVSANTQVNRLNFGELDHLLSLLLEKKIFGWQVQITAALGRAADHPEILFQPYDLLEFMPKLAELKRRCHAAGVDLAPGNNVGYFGPFESAIRSRQGLGLHWEGCGAGCSAIGIESDGTFKGCPSLPSREYAAGSLRKSSAGEIWARGAGLANLRSTTRQNLWGFCASCYYADVCKGGCTFTAHALLGKPGNQPYCYHRADELRRRGLRERLRPARAAPGQPFDHGIFELLEEPWPAGEFLEAPHVEIHHGSLSLLQKTRFPV
jgi:radical SAM protein with 4Fe4S-binding SPASM domain